MSRPAKKPVALRWMATIVYKRTVGKRGIEAPIYPDQVVKDFEEFSDLGEIVEKGPDWNLIDRIVVELNR